MDLQFVLNAYACVMYTASYMMETEKAIGHLLKQVTEEHRTEKQGWSGIFAHREVSAQETVYRALPIPMKSCCSV